MASGPLRQAFVAGERSPLRAVRALDYRIVELGTGAWATDLDSPMDLDR